MDWKIGHCIRCVQNDLYYDGRLSKKLPQAKHAFEAKDLPCILGYTIHLLGNWIFVKAANQPSTPWPSAGAKAPLSELYGIQCCNYH